MLAGALPGGAVPGCWPRGAGAAWGMPAVPAVEADRFVFRPRTGRINWRLIHSLDIDRVVREGDVDTIQEYLENVTYSRFGQEDLDTTSDQCVITLVQLAQLALEFLSTMCTSSQQLLPRLVDQVRRQAEQLRAAEEGAREARRRRGGHPARRRSASSGTPPEEASKHRCPHCPRRLRSEQLLHEHLLRRHPAEAMSLKEPDPPSAGPAPSTAAAVSPEQLEEVVRGAATGLNDQVRAVQRELTDALRDVRLDVGRMAIAVASRSGAATPPPAAHAPAAAQQELLMRNQAEALEQRLERLVAQMVESSTKELLRRVEVESSRHTWRTPASPPPPPSPPAVLPPALGLAAPWEGGGAAAGAGAGGAELQDMMQQMREQMERRQRAHEESMREMLGEVRRRADVRWQQTLPLAELLRTPAAAPAPAETVAPQKLPAQAGPSSMDSHGAVEPPEDRQGSGATSAEEGSRPGAAGGPSPGEPRARDAAQPPPAAPPPARRPEAAPPPAAPAARQTPEAGRAAPRRYETPRPVEEEEEDPLAPLLALGGETALVGSASEGFSRALHEGLRELKSTQERERFVVSMLQERTRGCLPEGKPRLRTFERNWPGKLVKDDAEEPGRMREMEFPEKAKVPRSSSFRGRGRPQEEDEGKVLDKRSKAQREADRRSALAGKALRGSLGGFLQRCRAPAVSSQRSGSIPSMVGQIVASSAAAAAELTPLFADEPSPVAAGRRPSPWRAGSADSGGLAPRRGSTSAASEGAGAPAQPPRAARGSPSPQPRWRSSSPGGPAAGGSLGAPAPWAAPASAPLRADSAGSLARRAGPEASEGAFGAGQGTAAAPTGGPPPPRPPAWGSAPPFAAPAHSRGRSPQAAASLPEPAPQSARRRAASSPRRGTPREAPAVVQPELGRQRDEVDDVMDDLLEGLAGSP